ncbi:MAG: phage protease [Coleofasciculus sp. C2-GNP5-27]
MARVGTWKGYHSGEPFSLTEEVFDLIAANFEQEKNPRPVYIGHPDAQGLEADAVGWIREVKAEDGKLLGLVEFTQDIAQRIKEGAFKFVSICADLMGAIHRETGEDIGAYLRSLGITNQPFIDGLEPLSLSENAEVKTVPVYLETTQEEIKHMSDTKQNVELEQVQEMPEQAAKDELSAVMEVMKEVAGNDELSPEAAVALLREKMDELKAMFSEEEQEEDAPASEEAVEASNLKTKLENRDSVIAELQSKVAALTETIGAFEAKEIESLVASRIANGSIPADKKEHFVKLCATDRELFEALTATAPKQIHLSKIANTRLNDSKPAASEGDYYKMLMTKVTKGGN